MPEDRAFAFMGRWHQQDLVTTSGITTIYDSTISRNHRQHNKILRIRDELRAALNDPLKWAVSDIMIWKGQSNFYEGYAFLVRKLNGAGVPTGDEWVFIFGGTSSTSTFTTTMQGIVGLANSANIDPYFVNTDNSFFFNGAGSVGIHYSSQSATDPNYRYEFG